MDVRRGAGQEREAATILCRQQVVAQESVEDLRPLLRKENPRARQLDRWLRPRDRFSQPVRPLHWKVDVVRTPDDQGRSLQLAQPRLDRHGVLVIESRHEALQVARTLFAPYQRP